MNQPRAFDQTIDDLPTARALITLVGQLLERQFQLARKPRTGVSPESISTGSVIDPARSAAGRMRGAASSKRS